MLENAHIWSMAAALMWAPGAVTTIHPLATGEIEGNGEPIEHVMARFAH
jgi:hypothetical protein